MVVIGDKEVTRRQAILIAVTVLVLAVAGIAALVAYSINVLACNPGQEGESGICHASPKWHSQQIIAYVGLIPACAALVAAIADRQRLSVNSIVATGLCYAAWSAVLLPVV